MKQELSIAIFSKHNPLMWNIGSKSAPKFDIRLGSAQNPVTRGGAYSTPQTPGLQGGNERVGACNQLSSLLRGIEGPALHYWPAAF